ncbi:Mss4-like protein [Pyrenochaeta sp. MPI-SDFR-AT-0127]|nr:Mss4-like protein [Pyrenochaeta sp. MPI-SDFR-AT-0127]
MSVRSAPRSEPYIPLSGLTNDGWSNDSEATATCYCGAVQLAFPTTGQGLLDSFLCHCTDCRKITASAFASNFVVADTSLRHIRGQENLKTFSQTHSIATGNTMTNHFCSTCGTLMYRVGSGYPGLSVLRLGTVDDTLLLETKLKPRREQFVKDSVEWFDGVGGGVHRSEIME